MTLAASLLLGKGLWTFVRKFGAFVFFPLGLLDMSVIPAPGSFDALLIFLVLSHKELWWYYVLMATAASVIGAWPTFRLGRKSGEEAIEKKLGPDRAKKIFRVFGKWGFWSLLVGAMAPPPMPAAAFIMTAGGMKYPWIKFLTSWTAGRLVRFGIVAWVAMRYGKQIFGWLGHYYKPFLWVLIAVGVIGGSVALYYYMRARKKRRREEMSGRQQNQAA